MDPIKELLQKMQEKLDRAKVAETAEEAKALMDEFDELKGRKEAMERAVEAEKTMAAKSHDTAAVKPQEKETGYDKAVKQMAKAARQAFKVVEGTDEDGGYIVPEDILTRIEHLREAKFYLGQLVSHENVKTDKGQRTYRKRTDQNGWTSVEEGGKIPLKATPQFGRMKYEIEKYGGIYAMTNEVLADTDQNLVRELTEWIAEDSRVTRNKLILLAMNEKYTREENPETVKTIASLDDLKHIVNIDLGQAFKDTSVIVTNDYGLDWLDCLKDGEGRYILRHDTQDPLKMYVTAGATRVRLVVVPKEDLPNEDGKAPFFIGDLKEGVRFWDRKRMSLKASDVASVGSGEGALNAFDEDLTLTRAIEREDCTVRDERAFVKALLPLETNAG